MSNRLYTRLQSLALYPNKEVRFSSRPVLPSRTKERGSKRDIIIPGQPEKISKEFIQWAAENNVDLPTSGGQKPPVDRRSAGGGGLPLVSSNEFEGTSNSRQKTPGYGLLKEKWPSFTSRARRAISLRASAIANVFPKKNQIFVTGTLPGSTDEAIEAMAKYSSWMMHRVQVWLHDNYSVDHDFKHYPRIKGEDQPGRRSYHLAVWEHQRRGALHYHGLIATPSSDDLLDEKRKFVIKQQSVRLNDGICYEVKEQNLKGGRFKQFWIGLLFELCEKSGVDVFKRHQKYGGGTWLDDLSKVRVDAQSVKHDISSYLSKYLSKEAGKSAHYDSSDSEGEKKLPPARWWASTRACRDLADAQTIFIPLPAALPEQSVDLIEKVREIFEDLSNFSCNLVNPYSKQTVGTIGIFDERNDAIGVFDVLRAFLDDYLAQNASEIAMLDRMRFSLYWEKVRQRRAILEDVERENSAWECLRAHTMSGVERKQAAHRSRVRAQKTLAKQWKKFTGDFMEKQQKITEDCLSCSIL